jgi:anti-sigma regulatory factor (Ser/Thr protein kinase)
MRFTAADLSRVREVTAGWAARAGLDAARVSDLVIAVNEIATNAVLYGSPQARLLLHAPGGLVVAEIRDKGNWQRETTQPSSEVAAAGHGGLGLPVTRQICEQVRIRAGTGGTVVTLKMRR